MQRYLGLLIPVLVLGAALTAACGGSSSKTVDIPGGGKISSSDKLPSDFPGDFPKYSGAKVKGSVTGQQQGISGTSVIWESGDGLDKVKSFFDGEFAKDNWKAEANGSAGDTAYWSGKSKDGKKVFYAGATNADGKTTITAVVGDNPDGASSGGSKTSTSGSSKTSTSGGSGSSANKTATSEAEDGSSSSSGPEKSPTPSPLPPEVKLPKDFPTARVPLPSGARVTSSTSFGQGGQKTYIITYFTKSSPDDVAKYFSDEMPKHGWSSAFSSNSNGELFVTFTSGDTGSGSNDGLTVTASDSTDTPGYTQVGVSVSLTGTTP